MHSFSVSRQKTVKIVCAAVTDDIYSCRKMVNYAACLKYVTTHQ
jgi:hypothetical protein